MNWLLWIYLAGVVGSFLLWRVRAWRSGTLLEREGVGEDALFALLWPLVFSIGTPFGLLDKLARRLARGKAGR